MGKHSISRSAIAVTVLAALSASSGAFASEEMAHGIKQMVDKQALVVKIDHLQSVDSNITANDQALLDHYKSELKKEQDRSE
jgi:hypothetical protein